MGAQNPTRLRGPVLEFTKSLRAHQMRVIDDLERGIRSVFEAGDISHRIGEAKHPPTAVVKLPSDLQRAD